AVSWHVSAEAAQGVGRTSDVVGREPYWLAEQGICKLLAAEPGDAIAYDRILVEVCPEHDHGLHPNTWHPSVSHVARDEGGVGSGSPSERRVLVSVVGVLRPRHR